MSDALPDDAWIQSFMSTSPKPLFDNLKRRLQASHTHVTAIAELYKQRAQIEAQYADSLAKLAKTAEAGGLNGKQAVDWEQSGGEAKLWNMVITDIVETSTSHSTLSALLRTDFEQPIRELPTKIPEWRRIHDQEAALEKTLKDYEKTATKLDKASSKSKSGKADALQSEIDQITRTLSTISPDYYRTYQRLDEERLKGLKEVVVRWGTVRGDMAGRDGQGAERTVAGLLGWETGDEVLAVGRKLGGNAPGQNRFPTLSSQGGGTPSRSMDRRLSSTPSGTSDFSPRPTPRTNGSSTNVTPSATGGGGGGGTGSGFSGLKSMLGRKATMGGRKDSRGRSGSVAASTRSDRDGGFETIGEDDLRSQPGSGPGGTGVAAIPPSSLIDDEGFSVPPPDRHRALWEEPNDALPPPIKSTPVGGATVPAPHTGSDTAGFNTNPNTNTNPNPNFTESPSGSQENLSSPTSSLHQGQPKLNLALAQAPIQESEEERQAALVKMQQTLQLQPTQPTRRGTVARGRRDVRNTMFAPGGLGTSLGSENGSPSGTPGVGGFTGAGAGAGIGLGSPFNQTNGSGSGDRMVPPIVSRQTSLSSVTSTNPFDSPSVSAVPGLSSSVMAPSTDPGLRASMTETINVIMKSGTVSRLQITGEIHLSLRASSSATTGPIHIRLNEFEKLEKIAPNPAYLAQVPDKPGEYFLNSEVLAAATARNTSSSSNLVPGSGSGSASKGTLLFKYQVHVQPGKETSMIPIVLDPAFSCKEGETRMILAYKSTSSPQLPVSALGNISLMATFNPGPGVSNVQTKPAGGVWSPVSRRLTWNLNELQETGKLIARFTTEENGNGNGEVMSPLGVQASWAIEGSLISGLGLEVVPGELEGDRWKFEEVKKGITTGKYIAEAIIN